MDAYREANRRQHRVFGHYLAVQAWLRELDCVALEREDLETYLGLVRFKSERIRWLIADLAPWFPYKEDFYKTSSESSLHSLFLSRVPIGKWLPQGTMTTEDRARAVPSDAPKTDLLFLDRKGERRVTEPDVVKFLAILDSGLEDPHSMQRGRQTVERSRIMPAPKIPIPVM